MDNKSNKHKNRIVSLQYLWLLIFILTILVLMGCEYQEEPLSEERINQISEPSNKIEENVENEEEDDLNPYDFVLTFAGDINFDENWSTMQHYNTVKNGIYDCISPELIKMMNDADIMCKNNEFTYSTGGVPLSNKDYTFRADPS